MASSSTTPPIVTDDEDRCDECILLRDSEPREDPIDALWEELQAIGRELRTVPGAREALASLHFDCDAGPVADAILEAM